MAKLQRPTLVGYFFGEPGTPRRRLRPAVAALSAAAALASAATVAVAVETGRSALDLSAALNSQYRPRRGDDGRVVNAYVVALENRGREPLAVRLAISLGEGEAVLRPDHVDLAPGEHQSLNVVAMAPAGKPGVAPAVLTARAHSGEPLRARVPFIVPGAP